MSSFLPILILTGFLLAGAFCHKIRLSPSPHNTEKIITVVLWALLAVMGFRLGNARELSSRIGEIGLLAITTAAFSLIGTICVIVLLYILVDRIKIAKSGYTESRNLEADNAVKVNLLKHFKGPGLLLAIVVAGFFVGFFLPEIRAVDFSVITSWVLNALLFMVGMQFAQSGLSLKEAFVRIDTIVVPLGTIIGSLLGGFFVSLVFQMAAGRGMALAAGFGWYSLSGVIITNLGDPVLGSAAFLANMFREAAALLLIPLLARTPYPYTAIGAGGATAMDVTLPLIEQCTGPESVPVSFTTGVLLSLLVPVLVPLLFGIGAVPL